MEQAKQKRVIEITKRLSDNISKETGVESPLQEEDIERYCVEALAEIMRN
jgi:hypothetical protein